MKVSRYAKKHFSTSVYMWTSNTSPGLRSDDYKNKLKIKNFPTKMEFFENKQASHIYTGPRHSAVALENGELYTCGSGNWGILGHGDESNVPTDEPRLVEYFAQKNIKIKKTALGDFHSIALTNEGEVYSWGRGGQKGYFFGIFFSSTGALGHESIEPSFKPKKIRFFEDNNIKIVDIACGVRHCVALSSEGDVYSWGHGEHGVLGNGRNVDRAEPSKNELLTIYKGEDPSNAIIKIDCADSYTACLTKGGNLYTWGRNNSGQLGIGMAGGADLMEVEKYPAFIKYEDEPFVDLSCGENVMMMKSVSNKLYRTGWRTHYTPTKFNITETVKPDYFFCGNKYYCMVSGKDFYQWGNLFSNKFTEKSDDDLKKLKEQIFEDGKLKMVSGKFKLIGAIIENN